MARNPGERSQHLAHLRRLDARQVVLAAHKSVRQAAADLVRAVAREESEMRLRVLVHDLERTVRDFTDDDGELFLERIALRCGASDPQAAHAARTTREALVHVLRTIQDEDRRMRPTGGLFDVRAQAAAVGGAVWKLVKDW